MRLSRLCETFGSGMELEQILNFPSYQEIPNSAGIFGMTLLHFAVKSHYDKFDIVEKLIKAGADVNAQKCNKTPLHLAVLCCNWRVIDTLIAYNADINIKDFRGNTALHFAIDLLWCKRQNEQETRSRMVKKLLHYGANPNISNSNGETPLMIAVKYGNLDIIKDLLLFGANVHCSNIFSETCLHLLSGCPQPNVAILNELVKHGACVNCCDHIGRTALDVLLDLTDKVGFGRQLEESFIKISTLVNWKHKIDFQVRSQNREKIQSLEKFMDECYKEVSQMKSHIYSNGYNLCHFAVNGGIVAKKDKSQISILDEVLKTIIKDEFPIYHDIIEDHFDKTFLKEKLLEMNIYTRTTKGDVQLHAYAISDIASYLAGRDLLNLIRAYATPINNSSKKGKINFSKC